MPLPVLPATMDADAARQALVKAGWREIGVGDWSWVYADHDDAWAARVTPFDPAYRMHAEACRDGPPNRYLPHVASVHPLQRDGYVVVMERLWPADEAKASELCARIDAADASPGDDDLTALRARIDALVTEGVRRFRLWGGADIRPGNVMVDATGQLKLIDPVFIQGKAIVAAIAAGDRDALSDFSRAQLEDFLTIPPFVPGAETDALRGKVRALFA